MAFHRARPDRIRTVAYLPGDLRQALELEARRSDRTLSALIERAVRLALPQIAAEPTLPELLLEARAGK